MVMRFLRTSIVLGTLAAAALPAFGGTRVNWAAVNAASRQIDAAKAELRRAADEARRQVEATEEYQQAVSTLRDAHASHREAVQSASAKVETSAEYIALDMKLQTAIEKVHQLHNQTPAASDNEIFSAATAVMDIRAEMNELRLAALADNEQVEAARYALIDAGMKVRLLREDAKARVTQSPAWQAARQQLDMARKQYAAAG